MGCCASRPGSGSHDGPYNPPVSNTHAQGPDSSSRHITAHSPQLPASIVSPRGSQASQSHAGPSHRQKNDRPNAPLKAIDPNQRCALPNSDPNVRQVPLVNSSTSQWTWTRLDKERAAFWDTQITGDLGTWRNLRAVIECIQDDDILTAQAMLDAAGCTCPTGRPWEAVFGARGERYKIPEWVVVEPAGLVEGDAPGAVTNTDEIQDHESELLEDTAKVRCRLSSTQKDVVVKIRRDEKVSSLVSKLHQQTQMPSSTTIRIFYRGQECRPDQPLTVRSDWSFENNHVLNAMMFD